MAEIIIKKATIKSIYLITYDNNHFNDECWMNDELYLFLKPGFCDNGGLVSRGSGTCGKELQCLRSLLLKPGPPR